jgi:hypothetical protein
LGDPNVLLAQASSQVDLLLTLSETFALNKIFIFRAMWTPDAFFIGIGSDVFAGDRMSAGKTLFITSLA